MLVQRRRQAAARLHRQGHRARHHRQDRHRRRHRLHDRVRRLGDPRPVDGRPHDGLQHGDRGGRARRAGRPSTRRPSPTSRAGRIRRAASNGTQAVRLLEDACTPMPTRTFDRVVELDAAQIVPQVTWGTSPEMVVSIDGRVPDPGTREGRRQARRDGTRAALHGARAEQADGRHPHRQGVHRLVHELRASRTCAKPPRSCRRWAGSVAGNVRLALVVPGSGLVKEQAEREGLDKVFTRRRLRMARARLLDVPGDERRPARAGRALRLDQQSQFRRPPGRRRPHAPRQPGDGGGGGHRRAFRRCASAILDEASMFCRP